MSQLFLYAAQNVQNDPGNFLSSLLSMAIVFVGLLAVMGVVRLINAVRSGPPRRTAQPAGAPAAPYVPEPVQAPKGKPATGSLGELKLHTVPDRTAAMIMAIVADEMHVPLNELRFISIREV